MYLTDTYEILKQLLKLVITEFSVFQRILQNSELVELAGVEPASEISTSLVLHA